MKPVATICGLNDPAPVKRKVLIAGGSPGGLYAAWTAARRGHQVILCEKEAELGIRVSTITNAVYWGCHAALDIE